MSNNPSLNEIDLHRREEDIIRDVAYGKMLPSEAANLLGISSGAASKRAKRMRARLGISMDDPQTFYSQSTTSKKPQSSGESLGIEDETQIGMLQRQIAEINRELHRYKLYSQNLKRTNETLLETLPKLPPLHAIPRFKKPPHDTPYDMVGLWSDWHGNERVRLDEMEGMNQFDFAIMCNRVWKLCEKMLIFADLQRQHSPIDVLHIDLLGDFISGDIHEELRETNEMPNLKACIQIATILAQAIAKVAQNFEKVVVTGIVGNHGRNTKKPRYKNRVENNYDSLIYQMASCVLKNAIEQGRILFQIPNSIRCIVGRKGWNVLLDHGDEIKSWAGISYYGVNRDNAKEHAIRRKVMGHFHDEPPIDFQIREMGHFHEFSTLGAQGTCTIMNGSLIGPNEYSRNRLQAVSPAQQILYFINEKYGVTSITPVYLQDADDEPHGFSCNPDLVMGEQATLIERTYGF